MVGLDPAKVCGSELLTLSILIIYLQDLLRYKSGSFL